MSGLPKGFLLNNPFDIKRNGISWKGESTLQDDPTFLRFDLPVDGLRAGMKILLDYQEVHEIQTINGMINRFAPSSENDTVAYIDDVCSRIGVNRLEVFTVTIPDNLIRLAQAIVCHELGTCPDPTLPQWYDETLYEDAAGMVLPPPLTPQ